MAALPSRSRGTLSVIRRNCLRGMTTWRNELNLIKIRRRENRRLRDGWQKSLARRKFAHSIVKKEEAEAVDTWVSRFIFLMRKSFPLLPLLRRDDDFMKRDHLLITSSGITSVWSGLEARSAAQARVESSNWRVCKTQNQNKVFEMFALKFTSEFVGTLWATLLTA